MKYYTLKNGKVKKEPSVASWSKWFENVHDRIVKRTTIKKGIQVSTVFLGLDHNFSGKGKPVLWETLTFGGKTDGDMMRYTSRADAVKGHAVAVKLAKKYA